LYCLLPGNLPLYIPGDILPLPKSKLTPPPATRPPGLQLPHLLRHTPPVARWTPRIPSLKRTLPPNIYFKRATRTAAPGFLRASTVKQRTCPLYGRAPPSVLGRSAPAAATFTDSGHRQRWRGRAGVNIPACAYVASNPPPRTASLAGACRAAQPAPSL